MKRRLLIIAVLAVVVAACGGQAEDTTTSAVDTTAGDTSGTTVATTVDTTAVPDTTAAPSSTESSGAVCPVTSPPCRRPWPPAPKPLLPVEGVMILRVTDKQARCRSRSSPTSRPAMRRSPWTSGHDGQAWVAKSARRWPRCSATWRCVRSTTSSISCSPSSRASWVPRPNGFRCPRKKAATSPKRWGLLPPPAPGDLPRGIRRSRGHRRGSSAPKTSGHLDYPLSSDRGGGLAGALSEELAELEEQGPLPETSFPLDLWVDATAWSSGCRSR